MPDKMTVKMEASETIDPARLDDSSTTTSTSPSQAARKVVAAAFAKVLREKEQRPA